MSQSIGIVGAKEAHQKTGKPRVFIDQKWYAADKVDMSSVQVGQRVDFQYESWMWQDKEYRGVVSWAFTPNQPTPEEAAAAKPPEKKQWTGKGGGKFNDKDRGLEIDLQCLRFVGQTVAALIEKDLIRTGPDLALWVGNAYEAIKFAKSWGATAPAPAIPPATATTAGPPSQTPPGGASYRPLDSNGNPVPVRPTGLFGWGQKYRETPWNVMEANNLQWFIEKSTAPSDFKQKCRDELWFREQDAQRAAALAPQTSGVDPDFDDDIPF